MLHYLYMAIQFTKENETKEEEDKRIVYSTVEISNGHLEQLRKITGDFGLKSDLHTLAFLLSVVNDGNGSPIRINGANYLPPSHFKK